MTEETEGSSNAPGSTAGDAAPTQAIPRIPKPVGDSTPAAKSAPAKPAPAKSAPAKPAVKKAPSAAQTDKGRPRQAPPAAKPAAASPTPPTAKAPPAPSKRTEPAGSATGRTMTAAEYARTTKSSPETTSIIPAVKDKLKSKKQSSPAATLAPNPGSGRRASLRLTRVEPWSVTRLAFAISVAMMIVAVVAVLIFWIVLDAVGVWDQINDSFTTVLSDDTSSFNVTDYFGIGRVAGLTLVLSAVNVVVMTALATIAAHLYNLAAQLMGGIELTFAEEK